MQALYREAPSSSFGKCTTHHRATYGKKNETRPCPVRNSGSDYQGPSSSDRSRPAILMATPPPLPAPPLPEPTGGIIAPAPVVALHFCAPYVVQLSVKEKFTIFKEGDFTITDTNGAIVVTVKGSYISIHNNRLLLDTNGNPLLTLREKVISMHNTWEAYRGDSSKSSDLLFTAKKSSIIQPFKTEMYIYLASNTSHEVCDFKMNGSFKERACSFYLGDSNTLIAQMHRQHTAKSTVLGRDYYGVTVFPNADYVFISALVVILQELHTDKND